MISRFFKVAPEQIDGFRATLLPDKDVLALALLKNSKVIYEDAEKAIIDALLTPRLLADIAEYIEVDPLTVEGIQRLDILGSYCGEEYTDRPLYGLFWYYPELAGTKDDEEGDSAMLITMRHVW